MSNQSCTDCRWLSEPNEGHKWHVCEVPLVLPKSISSTECRAVNIHEPFIGCPTYEKRPLSRGEQIEAAARALVDGRAFIEPWLFTNLRDALALPKFAASSEPAPAPKPTEAEMRRAVMEAGWTPATSVGLYRDTHDSRWPFSLGHAYARVMREKQGVGG